MIDYSILKSLEVADGSVKKMVDKIEVDGEAQWYRTKFRYVSLGDSIAAGHLIRQEERLNIPRCWEWQYGTEGIESTELIPGCYTDLIRAKLEETYGGKEHIKVTTYARSGDQVSHVMAKLRENDHKNPVAKDIRRANLVTLCIGANDVLVPCMYNLEKYIDGSMSLDTIARIVETNLKTLDEQRDEDTDEVIDEGLYMKLFKELYDLNPNAKFVFTTIYNPYKYLWLVDGKEEGSFFYPVVNAIPDIELFWGAVDVGEYMRNIFMDSGLVRTLFNRVNGLNAWAENYVDELNNVLKARIDAFNELMKNVEGYDNNFLVADSKALFDTIPDRDKPYSDNLHYNDLVHCEFTAGYNTAKMDWGALWRGKYDGLVDWWASLLWKYFWDESTGSVVDNSVSCIADALGQIIFKVIVPNVDPHPESHGHYALYRSFADALGWESLKTVSFNANGGNGEMETQKVLDTCLGKTVCSILDANTFSPASGCRFIGWNTDSNGGGANYANTQAVPIASDDTTLYAQWSNQCIIRYKHSKKTDWANLGELGINTDPNKYALWIDATELDQLDRYSEDVFSVPYGAPIGVVVGSYSSSLPTFADTNCTIYLDGERKKTTAGQAAYDFVVTSDMEIDFQWHTTGVELDANSGSKTSYEECHITTFDASYQQLTQPYSITFKANGGQGSMATQQVLRLNNLPVRALLNHNAFTRSGLYYRGWNTSASDSGTSYSDREIIQLTSDLVLYAMWKYLLIFKHSEDSQYHGPSDTGPQENYGLYIEGTDQDYDNDLSDFSNPQREYYVLPGTLIKVNVKSKYDKAYSYISWNGTIPKDNPNYSAVNKTSEGKGTDVTYIFNLNNNVTLHYEWTVRGVDALGVQLNPESYWNCYITTN